MSKPTKPATAKVSILHDFARAKHKFAIFWHKHTFKHVISQFLTLFLHLVQERAQANALKAIAGAKAERHSWQRVARDLTCDRSVVTVGFVRYHAAKRRDPTFHNGNSHAFWLFLIGGGEVSVRERADNSRRLRNVMGQHISSFPSRSVSMKFDRFAAPLSFVRSIIFSVRIVHHTESMMQTFMFTCVCVWRTLFWVKTMFATHSADMCSGWWMVCRSVGR